MNSLEIINKRIKFLEDMIFMDLALIEDEDDLEGIAEKQKELNILQQIKEELEAWYVIQPNIRFEEHSRAWIYLDKIYQDEPSYSIIEKKLLNNPRSITVVSKEGNKITVKRTLEVEDDK